jgi:hypothetical protein
MLGVLILFDCLRQTLVQKVTKERRHGNQVDRWC